MLGHEAAYHRKFMPRKNPESFAKSVILFIAAVIFIIFVAASIHHILSSAAPH
jgi:uncharacterized membrane protein required for colicin V production